METNKEMRGVFTCAKEKKFHRKASRVLLTQFQGRGLQMEGFSGL